MRPHHPLLARIVTHLPKRALLKSQKKIAEIHQETDENARLLHFQSHLNGHQVGGIKGNPLGSRPYEKHQWIFSSSFCP